jgi:hypothetical protein
MSDSSVGATSDSAPPLRKDTSCGPM